MSENDKTTGPAIPQEFSQDPAAATAWKKTEATVREVLAWMLHQKKMEKSAWERAVFSHALAQEIYRRAKHPNQNAVNYSNLSFQKLIAEMKKQGAHDPAMITRQINLADSCYGQYLQQQRQPAGSGHK